MSDDVTRIRVLIVDDRGAMRSRIKRLLGQVEIEDVVEADNGEQAIDLLASADFIDPDAIICDLHMDKMDGIEFCYRVRPEAGIRDRHIPILILTGDKDSLLHEVSQQVGATAVLTKPITAPELLKEIETAIGFSVSQ